MTTFLTIWCGCRLGNSFSVFPIFMMTKDTKRLWINSKKWKESADIVKANTVFNLSSLSSTSLLLQISLLQPLYLCFKFILRRTEKKVRVACSTSVLETPIVQTPLLETRLLDTVLNPVSVPIGRKVWNP